MGFITHQESILIFGIMKGGNKMPIIIDNVTFTDEQIEKIQQKFQQKYPQEDFVLTLTKLQNIKPFRIDENGKIYAKQDLQTWTYKFQVIVSDWKNQTLSKTITIKVTSPTAVEDAIKSWIVTDVTEKELLDKIISELSNKQNRTENGKILFRASKIREWTLSLFLKGFFSTSWRVPSKRLGEPNLRKMWAGIWHSQSLRLHP